LSDSYSLVHVEWDANAVVNLTGLTFDRIEPGSHQDEGIASTRAAAP
jgi:hypothetical protein